jgi:hypothetical protein
LVEIIEGIAVTQLGMWAAGVPLQLLNHKTLERPKWIRLTRKGIRERAPVL